ncbi:MAG: DUF6599 family protein [Acidobacteriaceae bacterium]
MPRIITFRSLMVAPMLLLGAVLFATPLVAKPAAAPATPAQPVLLPVAFGGWEQAGTLSTSTDPAAADSANAVVLQEYGFQRFAAATYTQPDGKLSVKAIQFADATGAYGAYTYYLRPNMTPQEIGTNAGFDGSHVLFWKGNDLVEAQFDHLTAMSAAQLRELAQMLPPPAGNVSVPPTLPSYLPRAGIDRSTIRYAIGPVAYSQSGGVLPPSLVDFDRDAEAITAKYTSRDGDGILTVLSYPTPQMAEERTRAIEAFLKAGNTPQATWPSALAQSAATALGVRRSGPLVIVTSGNFSQDEALRVRNRVNFQANVTWNDPRSYVSDVYKAARLYLNIFILVGILVLAAVLMGVFLGGGRALYRVLRGKPASSVSDTEFIRLDLNR